MDILDTVDENRPNDGELSDNNNANDSNRVNEGYLNMINEYKEQNESLEQKITELNEEVNHLNNKLDMKNELISNIKQEIGEIEVELKNKDNEIASLKNIDTSISSELLKYEGNQRSKIKWKSPKIRWFTFVSNKNMLSWIDLENAKIKNGYPTSKYMIVKDVITNDDTITKQTQYRNSWFIFVGNDEQWCVVAAKTAELKNKWCKFVRECLKKSQN